ncbi:MAG: tRNA preQ1(34) S-adenosylmethionine ribosyltransferase-isomerase QueA [Planctomycetaceae bacterium]|nr:MAG: tRNA preQ1(34) S-adenosylmethionine ribosyltransferase-isomerase QueA [Planctomycetaceae bacterium]
MAEIDHYDFDLPRQLIAQQPLACRSDARLLVVHRQQNRWEHSHVRNLLEFLDPADALVLNNTRVVPARLVGMRTKTAGRWSGLFLAADESGIWQVMSKTRGKLVAGESVTLLDRQHDPVCQLVLLSKLPDGQWLASPDTREPTLDLLERIGRVPLPPYIRDGEMVDQDRQNYQTVFAQRPGAVAAPTAGLHFTEELLNRIRGHGVRIHQVTLHVGMGTFRPVAVERLSDHVMHSEWAEMDQPTADRLQRVRDQGGRLVAVGTTVVRTLETIASSGPLRGWQGQTDLFIRPPYQFRAIDALMTNFHLPKSTLLVLVRTFGGDDLIRRAYDEAIREEYRFFSYGDAMLIL